MDGKTQAAAAAASGMSLRTAREWDTGPVPSATKQPRDWRTRPDPFAAVWHDGRGAAVAERPQGRPRSEVWCWRCCGTRYPEQFHAGAGADAAAAVSRLAGAARRRARGVLRASRRARARGGDRFHARDRPRRDDRRRAVSAPALRVRAQLQPLDVGGGRVRRDVRGAGGRRARRAVGARRRAGRPAQRQSVGRDARAESQ